MDTFDKLVIALISPLGASLMLGCISLALRGLSRSRVAFGVSLCAVVWLWIWSTPVASQWARSRIEADYPPLAVEALPYAEVIVVLGGAMQPVTERRPYPHLGAAADRMWHAARLFHAGKAPRILLSGGGGGSTPDSQSEARAMGEFMVALGVPFNALLFEERSRNTRENAGMSAALLKSNGVTKILLVTSALHMARAVIHFEAMGLGVHPASTDHEVGPRDLDLLGFVPSADSLDGSARAIKEWTALWWWRRHVRP